MRIISKPLDTNDNPLQWTEADLDLITEGEFIIGYLIKNAAPIEEDIVPVLNLYLYDNLKTLSDPTKIISLALLQNIFLQWVESLREDLKSYMFRNPPLEEWLDTKKEWVKKISYKLSQSYGRNFDECMSTLYMTILNIYNKSDKYLGNLHYIVVAVNNEIRREFKFMRNRWHGGHPDALHLDADFQEGVDDSISSLHEIIGGPTYADLEELRLVQVFEEIREDMKKEFSPREMDQIVNTPGFLPLPLYRRLLKWRKTHKLEDYL